MSDTRFTPARGVEKNLLANPYTEGMLYFATDSGRIFLDSNGDNKIPLGGGGVSIIYGYDENVITDLVEQTYTLHANLLENGSNPKVGDLIINSDGKFYKIQEILVDEGLLVCILIAVSGTGGGGGGGGTVSSVIKLEEVEGLPSTVIYEQPYNVSYKVTSEEDNLIRIKCIVVNSVTKEEKPPLIIEGKSGEICTFDLGSRLFKGTNLVIIWGEDYSNNSTAERRVSGKNAIELALNPSSDFNALKVKTSDEPVYFYCVPIGEGLDTKKVVVEIDPESGGWVGEEKNIKTSQKRVDIEIPRSELSHGMHTLRATLWYGDVATKSLIYQFAYVEQGNPTPIIWHKEVPDEITNHDKLTIYYKVYNPLNTKSEVRLFINELEIPTSPFEVSYNSEDPKLAWDEWQVTNYTLGTNTFRIKSGKAQDATFTIKVKEDTYRQLDVLTNGLHVMLDSKGRSNKENRTVRSTWEYTNNAKETTSVKFNNFNWYNNGWILDENHDSCLRISNGASIDIPLKVLETETLTNGLTFEFQFKLFNVQTYATLVGVTSSEDPETGEVKVEKHISSTDSVFAKYFNQNIGLCLGTQEAFFKTYGDVIVNGRYKEDSLVNLAFVVEAPPEDKSAPLIYIYINGIMSGIATYRGDRFDAKANTFTFNSDYCDIDLYKMRVYKKALTSAEIVHNYIADFKDAELYDMNQILDNNSALPMIDYNKLITYNYNNPDNPTMPYAVLEVRDETDEKLPYVKGGKKRVNVTFVNPSLDRAYELGNITGAQYLEGCPSFYAENAEFDVQGTSSQGYPRRNYKGKFKSKSDAPVVWNYTNGPLVGQSLQDEIEYEGKEYQYYYMDNKDASESTFTWKADFMESSGTHNTGFTSFVKTLYSHHPLKDYDADYVSGDHRTTIYGFPMLVFQKYKSTGKYEFIGKYNFNLDKACNNVIDFENGNTQPYVLNNPNVDEHYQTYEDKNKEIQTATYEMIAECWEFKNNQGTRCSFKKNDFDEINLNTGLLSVIEDIEYRYSYYKDDIDDAIDGKNQYVNKDLANALLRDKYRNIERLFLWLATTDTSPDKVTNEPFDEPITINGKTFDKDDVAYRLAKFTKEFPEHFNQEYCEIYFIMTELILGYDSRGKNMMLGTWGPQSETGEYIWYPIFYDVDTQLGVNNSGVPTWEYDTDATKDSQFSTANSVLWNNFWTCFESSIKKRYEELRKDTLTIEKLNGFYDFDPAISKSYAMMGCRPLVAYNIDEYYKYIAPAYTGFINTDGDPAKTETFFYCLQGTRELHRELFLRNRFNYLDSAWMGGPYAAAAAQGSGALAMRFNANDAEKTSDKFIEVEVDINSLPAEEKPRYEAFEANNGSFGVPYKSNALDTDIDYDIKPYLKQYVSMYYDGIAIKNTDKYNGEEEPVTLTMPEDKQNPIKNSPKLSQQLIYIPAPAYVSSLGDLSTKYLNQLWLESAIRLKDLTIGNEDPAYKNTLLEIGVSGSQSFTFGNSALDAAGKPNAQAKKLLETIVLTNLGSFSGKFDTSGSEKLKTCRALGTQLADIVLADGVQIETLYLPNTLTKINLIEPVELSGLLRTKPVANAEGEFPKGLYVEGITDANISNTSVTKIAEINIIGGKKLYYDSYYLLDTLVKIKDAMQHNANLDVSTYRKDLKINLENVQWTPYRQVEYGEEASVTGKYYFLQDNYTFTTYTDMDNWEKDTLNGKVYEFTESLLTANSNAITNLDLINTLIESRNSAENYFTGPTRDLNGKSLAYISGNIFVNNTPETKISEFQLKDKYKAEYPNLNIYVNYVEPAYTAKYIQLKGEQEVEWDIIKYDPATTQHPTISLKEDPEQLHYDFKGWALTPNGEVLTEAQINNLTFTSQNPVITFYAVFEVHKYAVNFINPTNEENSKTIYISSGEKLHEPEDYLPYKDDANLDFDKTYKFIGYSNEPDSTKIVKVSDYTAVRDYTFYAVHEEISVYQNLIDTKYFTFTEEPYEENSDGNDKYNLSGYKITPAPGIILEGKITIPAEYNDQPIVSIGDFSNQKITHIFFEPGSQLRKISSYAFCTQNVEPCRTLKYFEFIDSIRYIGRGAFRNVPLEMTTLYMPKLLHEIGCRAFLGAFKVREPITIIIGSELEILNPLSFGNHYNNIPKTGNTIIIGSAEERSYLDLSKCPDQSSISNEPMRIKDSRFTTIEFYSGIYTSPDQEVYYHDSTYYTVRGCLDFAKTALQIIN